MRAIPVALVVAAAGTIHSAAGAVDWVGGALENGQAQAAAAGKPLMVFVFRELVNLPAGQVTPNSQLASEEFDRTVLQSDEMAGILGQFVCMKFNEELNQTLFATLGAPRRVPSLIFVEPGGKTAFAHCSATITGLEPARAVELSRNRLAGVVRIRDLAPRMATLAVEAKRDLSDAYLMLGMREAALPLLKEIVDAGGLLGPALINEYAMLLLVSGRADDAIEALNNGLANVRVRKWREGDPQLYRPGMEAYSPLLFEKPSGEAIGVVYTVTDVGKLTDLIRKVEFIATKVAPPETVTGEYAANVGDTCFEIENTRLALAYYERARLDPDLPLDRLETAWARIALCRLYLKGDDAGSPEEKKAHDEIELFLAKFTEVRKTVSEGNPHYRPEMLMYAGALRDRAGDRAGARRAYEQVMADYKDTDFDYWARQAQLELRALDLAESRR